MAKLTKAELEGIVKDVRGMIDPDWYNHAVRQAAKGNDEYIAVEQKRGARLHAYDGADTLGAVSLRVELREVLTVLLAGRLRVDDETGSG